jgi:hypothetical protein
MNNKAFMVNYRRRPRQLSTAFLTRGGEQWIDYLFPPSRHWATSKRLLNSLKCGTLDRAADISREALFATIRLKERYLLPAGWQPVTTGKTDVVDFAGF